LKQFFRHFSWIVTIPLAFVVIVFGIANREPVVVDLWPLPLSFEAPLVLVIFFSFVAGFLIGALIMWFSAGRYRRRAREARNRVAQLEYDVRVLQHDKARAEAKAAAVPGTTPGVTSGAAKTVVRQQGSTSLPAA
jgi:uncharacterized integral membrane protein